MSKSKLDAELPGYIGGLLLSDARVHTTVQMRIPMAIADVAVPRIRSRTIVVLVGANASKSSVIQDGQLSGDRLPDGVPKAFVMASPGLKVNSTLRSEQSTISVLVVVALVVSSDTYIS